MSKVGDKSSTFSCAESFYYGLQLNRKACNSWLRDGIKVSTYEKSLQALSECGKMEAVEIEKEINYEIS